MLNNELHRRLTAHRRNAAESAASFHARYSGDLDRNRDAIRAAMNTSIARFEQSLAELSGGNAFCADLARRTAVYIAWMEWALGDLPYYAVALGYTPGEMPAALGPCILTYLSGRVLDDFLDRHFLYRGKRYTLLAALAEDGRPGGEADALTVLIGLLLTMNGLLQLDADAGGAGRLLRQIVSSFHATLLGTLMDRSGPESWTPEFYERLIRHKNVDYWLLLYDALDPGHSSPLCPVLMDFHALAQKINDLEDYPRDELQGSANIVPVFRRSVAAASGGGGKGEDRKDVLASVEENVAVQLLALFGAAEDLPEPARSAVLVKLGESSDNLDRLGLFQPAVEHSVDSRPARIGLAWYSELAEFVQRLGVDALEDTACPVCGSAEARPVFRKQGFEFQRCLGCSHLYVSPRLPPGAIAQLASESPERDHDPFLQSQKIYAEFICRTLARHSPGQRLIDVGHGEGHLMMAARALGFQAYGIDLAEGLRGPLEEMFASRLRRIDLEHEALPWGSFDHAVLSHVLEHLADLPGALARIHSALNPDGLLYVAVPDSDSLQFKLLGRNWDAVNPLAHPQFFNESSLTALLGACGFERVERVRSPPLRGRLAERWMGLFDRLGGDAAGELALVARKIPRHIAG